MKRALLYILSLAMIFPASLVSALSEEPSGSDPTSFNYTVDAHYNYLVSVVPDEQQLIMGPDAVVVR